MAADAAKAKTKKENEDATRSIVLVVRLLEEMFNCLIPCLNGGEAAVGYELSDGGKYQHHGLCRPLLYVILLLIPIAYHSAQGFDRRRDSER